MSQPAPLPTSGRDSQPHDVNPPTQNRSLLSAFARFFLTGPDAAPLTNEAEIKHRYTKNRLSVMLSITLGYAMYYVVRQGYAVVKKPLLEAKIFDAGQIGAIGSVFFMTYMIGKCVNGFLADRLNIKRFLSLGLLASSA